MSGMSIYPSPVILCIVWLCYPHRKGGSKDWYTPKQKQTLDLIHLSKIEESDAIFVVDVGGYVGESTAREIEWAEIRGKSVFMLSKNHAAVCNLLGV